MIFKHSNYLNGTTKGLVIINIYDSPPNSSYKARKIIKGDTESRQVDQFCSKLPADSLLFIAGDMNARNVAQNSISGYKHRVLQELLEHELFRDDNSLTPRSRNSKDSVLNERGTQLIDFGCEWNLTILNVFVFGDVLGD